MNQRWAVWLLVGALMFPVQARAAGAKDPDLATRLEAYLMPFVETGNFSGAVLAAKGGKVLFRRAYGLANVELNVPNTPETRFHIASVSKPFTAMAILQLEEQGRLSLADPVSRFLPDFPEGARITLDHLLTHTSGIPNINDQPDYDAFARCPHDLPMLIARISRLPLDFPPGTKYRYSNSNYNLLARILEIVSGEGYGAYLHKHIFVPAGMTDTGHHGEEQQVIPRVATGYQPAGLKGLERAPHLDWSNKTGNGSLYSTLEDLYRFDRALRDHVLLKETTLQKYFGKGRGNRYGWFFRNAPGPRGRSANGRSPGFTAELDAFQEDDATLIVLSNSYATVAQDPIAEGAAAILLGQPAPALPALRPVQIPQKLLGSYAGRYQYDGTYFIPHATFELVEGEGHLVLKLGNSRAPLVPLSESEFLDRAFFGTVAMTRDSQGDVSGLTYRYGASTFTARRVGPGR